MTNDGGPMTDDERIEQIRNLCNNDAPWNAGTLTCTGLASFILSARESVVFLLGKVRELQAITSTLPKTEDGVTMRPNMIYYALVTWHPAPQPCFATSWEDLFSHNLTRCYSTYAAAEVAKGAKK